MEANEQNITKLTLDVLFTIIYGSWLLSSECKMKYYHKDTLLCVYNNFLCYEYNLIVLSLSQQVY